MVSALSRKLIRDLSQLRGQVVTIALVTACGIAAYATTKGTYYSLLYARDAYYERYRMADIFVQLERAPEALRSRIEALDGVAVVYTRVAEHVNLPLEGLSEPATGHLLSLPSDRRPPLGDVSLTSGRMPEPGRPDEVVVLDAFAEAHGLTPGHRLPAVLNGVRRDLRVVGTVLSPEYVFAVAPGEFMPDPRRFGVLFMDRELVAAAYRMEAAFNDVQVRLQPGASAEAVIEQLNRLLAPYGGSGAYPRRKQLSNNVLEGELAQLEATTSVVPLIFLGVAAFLINIVLSRLVQIERPQIAALKALGYSNRTVGLHYLKLVALIVMLGGVIGVSSGAWLGGLTTEMYTRYFAFPELGYRLDPRLLAVAVLISALAAVAGALFAVRSVIALPPAEAMRPEPPAAYRRSLSDRLRLSRLFGQSARMVLRELERRPMRTALSSIGVGMSVAVLVAGRFGFDAIDWFMEVQFAISQREDVSVTFVAPVTSDALSELSSLPGVLAVEGQRLVNVRYRNGHRERENVLIGHQENATLRRVVDEDGRVHQIPSEGVMLTRKLADILALRVGDPVEVELLEGDRSTHVLPVVGVAEEVFGLQGHMQLPSLSRLLQEEPRVSLALLRIDSALRDDVYRELKKRPLVLGVNRRSAAVEMFRNQTAGQMHATTLILTVFAAIIAVGVIYNNARVALSTRGRDLASLRVIGFRRSEISAILLGELAIQVVLAIVPGMVVGTWMAKGMMAQADPEMYRFPVIISARTYAFAALVTAAAALASALLVRRKLDHLDLIAVLKTRE